MPLIKIEAVAPDVRLGLWKIEETIELFFAANPHLQDLCSRLSDYQSTSRRLEILATYGLLFAMTNNSRLSITHYPNGKPHVEGYHVSISHTRGYAVLLISTNKEVAVDIEYYSNRVSRIVHKFIRQDEISSSVDIQLINWSAKETVYKLFSVEALQYFYTPRTRLSKGRESQDPHDDSCSLPPYSLLCFNLCHTKLMIVFSI